MHQQGNQVVSSEQGSTAGEKVLRAIKSAQQAFAEARRIAERYTANNVNLAIQFKVTSDQLTKSANAARESINAAR